MVAPCTDWYLGFTKIANGDVRLILHYSHIIFYYQVITSTCILLPILNNNP